MRSRSCWIVGWVTIMACGAAAPATTSPRAPRPTEAARKEPADAAAVVDAPVSSDAGVAVDASQRAKADARGQRFQWKREEWDVAIRSVEPPCPADQVRLLDLQLKSTLFPERLGLYSEMECPKTLRSSRFQDAFSSNVVARLDPLHDARGAACHYNYCVELPAATAPSNACLAPRVIETWCYPAPEGGTTRPAAAPFEHCPKTIALASAGSTRYGRFPGRFDPAQTRARTTSDLPHCCYTVCAPPGPAPVR